MNDQAIEDEVKTKGLTAPRVTLADLQENVVDVEIHKHVTKSGQVLRWAILTTRCGFAVVGNPSCAVSAENDNEDLGTKVAIDNSRGALWPLMGYALRDRMHDESSRAPVVVAFTASVAGPTTFQDRVRAERAELSTKVDKLVAFLTSATADGIDLLERVQLTKQSALMQDYLQVLDERIEAFEPAHVVG